MSRARVINTAEIMDFVGEVLTKGARTFHDKVVVKGKNALGEMIEASDTYLRAAGQVMQPESPWGVVDGAFASISDSPFGSIESGFGSAPSFGFDREADSVPVDKVQVDKVSAEKVPVAKMSVVEKEVPAVKRPIEKAQEPVSGKPVLMLPEHTDGLTVDTFVKLLRKTDQHIDKVEKLSPDCFRITVDDLLGAGGEPVFVRRK